MVGQIAVFCVAASASSTFIILSAAVSPDYLRVSQAERERAAKEKNAAPEIRMGNSVLTVSGFFKQGATDTAADKMMKVLEAEAATQKTAI